MSVSTKACPQCALEFSGGEVFCPVDGARLVAIASRISAGGAEDPLLDQTLAGRYRIVRKIGEGGMGIVYEAVHVVIEKRVALKILREDFSHRPELVERFRQEAKSASRIGHEHIVDISDFGVTASGAHFFVMELLEGHDLAEELERRGPLATRRSVAIALQCAKALGAAHSKGIVHRDMKPENVFLLRRDTGEDFVKIVDFGIAKMSEPSGAGGTARKLTKTGTIFGTPEYMSPEQAQGRPLDHRVDIYALGIILYELLTGRVPFLGDTFMGILTQHIFEPVPPLRAANPSCSAPPELERLILRAVAKNADERPQTMEELAGELAHVLHLLQSLSPASSSAPPPGTITHVERAPRAVESLPPRAVSARPEAPAAPKPTTARGRAWVRGLGVAGALAAGLAAAFWVRSQPASSREEARAPRLPPPIATPGAAPHPSPLPGGEGGGRASPLPGGEGGGRASPLPGGEGEGRAPATEPVPVAREVAIEVLTRPEGASVLVDGGVACAPTPCRFQTLRGAAIKLAVEKAGFRASSTELTPERDLHQLELVLRRKAAPRTGNRMEGDLMLPDAFGKR